MKSTYIFAPAAILVTSLMMHPQVQEQELPSETLPRPRASAACPQGAASAVLIDTKGNQSQGQVLSGQNNPRVTVGFSSAGEFARARVRIDLSPPCEKATVVVEYDGEPHGWTVHLSDSGMGDGDGGITSETSPYTAELVVRGPVTGPPCPTGKEPHRLEVFASQAGTAPGQLITGYDICPQDSAIRFVLRNQFLWWGQPHNQVPNFGSNRLFQIPDTGLNGDGGEIYLGLNRVVHPSSTIGRVGTHVRRAIIWVE
jgi:hypothetical protein